MMRGDFVAFILTHGRAGSVITDKTLRKCGYTGPIVYVIDNEDRQVDKYKQKFHDVIMFDKLSISKTFDEADNFEDRRSIVYARNACFDIAKELGYKYFIELDDDYDTFSFTYGRDGTVKQRTIKQLDRVFEAMVRFYESTSILTVAMAQRGDFVGGKENDIIRGEKLKRKAMNSFICSTDKSFHFVGRINEDVNTYTTLGSRGYLFLQVPHVALNQKQTQSNKGGMTDIYINQGTYVKSFYTVMMMPSSVKVGLMGNSMETKRLHHIINWNNTVPKIMKESFKKK
ncbi:hypothetical protein [Bacteroides nordii]|uniref:GREB1-related protein n=1 Tax=Bacteroides nordii TaxID=291645 RepID=UPI001F44F21C|nr:hypothetical protein [Bacteroides nordii]MCE8465872.1 hypothetical protein [Bacteroides nordii]UYU49782.1 hypothetical protein KQP55_04005 [Bacteroides nordii]